jgi:hypothetical protein
MEGSFVQRMVGKDVVGERVTGPSWATIGVVTVIVPVATAVMPGMAATDVLNSWAKPLDDTIM